MTGIWILWAAIVAGILFAEYRRHRYWKQYRQKRGSPQARKHGSMRGRADSVGLPPFPADRSTQSLPARFLAPGLILQCCLQGCTDKG